MPPDVRLKDWKILGDFALSIYNLDVPIFLELIIIVDDGRMDFIV